MKALSGFYFVQTEDSVNVFMCRARGLFKKENLTPLVGDLVTFERNQELKLEGTIMDVAPRICELNRPPIANVDLALVVFSLVQPDLNLHLLDKFLVHVELCGVKPVICFTKADLLNVPANRASFSQQEIARICEIYRQIGYHVCLTSVHDGTGIEQLKSLLDHHITVIAGQSGTGKSSLLNKLIPELTLATGEISRKLGRGKHTTRHVELFPIGTHGLIADTPGFSQLELPDIQPSLLTNAYPEFIHLAATCKFRGCLHIQEPDCGIVKAVHQGTIASSRYEHYVALMKELNEKKRRY